MCDCTESTDSSFIPDTFRLSALRVLPILIAKVDALVPVLGASIVSEFVEKPLHMVIGSEPPSNIAQIHALAMRKCAMDILSSTLDDEYTSLLHSSTKYPPPQQLNPHDRG